MPNPLRRPRVRRSIELAARRALSASGSLYELTLPAPSPSPPPPPPPPPQPQASELARELPVGRLVGDRDRVSSLLASRLDEDDVRELERRLEDHPELKAHYSACSTPAPSSYLVLAYGVWLGVASICEKTGLTAHQPPGDVHAMARGPLAAAGGLYEANMVADALAGTGVDVANVRDALDFGCSSGRVIHVLNAAYPDTAWRGCDPNGPAIAWAGENLPGIDFFLSGDSPPLPLTDGSLDLVYAISIWSHFAPDLGLRWFEEMRRVIRPGGHLVCTTHGLVSVGFYATRELRTPEQSREIADVLYRQGAWYAPEFGEEGDWGVVNPEWGTAFLSPEWMLSKLTPQWRVLEFAPGRNQENQDVYVLQRA